LHEVDALVAACVEELEPRRHLSGCGAASKENSEGGGAVRGVRVLAMTKGE